MTRISKQNFRDFKDALKLNDFDTMCEIVARNNKKEDKEMTPTEEAIKETYNELKEAIYEGDASIGAEDTVKLLDELMRLTENAFVLRSKKLIAKYETMQVQLYINEAENQWEFYDKDTYLCYGKYDAAIFGLKSKEPDDGLYVIYKRVNE